MSSQNFLSEKSEDGDGNSDRVKQAAGRCRVAVGSTVVVLLSLSLCMSVACLGLTRLVAHRMAELQTDIDGVAMSADAGRGLCLPCEDLELGALSGIQKGGDLLMTYSDVETRKEMCCANNEKQASVMLALFVEKQQGYKEARSDACPEELKVTLSNNGSTCLIKRPQSAVAAHVAGVKPKSDIKSQIITDWNSVPKGASSQTSSFLRNVESKDGRLVVSEPGLYFVYSQIYFFQTSLHTTIRHYISKNSRKNEEPLFEHLRTRCFGMSTCEHTSYVGGVVQLEAHDELYVGVSDRSSVHHDSKTTYFGLYKL